MPDEGATLPATGLVVAYDLVNAKAYQRIKLDGGGDGIVVPIVAGQQLSAESLPIVGASDWAPSLGPGNAIVGQIKVVDLASNPIDYASPLSGAMNSVAAVTTSWTLLGITTARKGATFYNDSTATLYLLAAAGTASSTVFTVKIPPDGYYELAWCQNGPYRGSVKGAWSAATGFCRVTEYS